MKTQYFTVKSVVCNLDTYYKESSVELITNTGANFLCFLEGYTVKEGEIIAVAYFHYFDSTYSFEDIFSKNTNRDKKLVHIKDYNYIAYGEVVDIENNDLIVDCGDVFIPLLDISSDRRCIGEFVAFDIENLEMELE